jgi:hypothetical protein
VFGLGDPYEDARVADVLPLPLDGASDAGADGGSRDPAVLLYESFDTQLPGTCVDGSCAISADGKHNGALLLDGTGCLQLTLSAQPHAFTIAFWAKAIMTSPSTLIARSTEVDVDAHVWKLDASDQSFTFAMWDGTSEGVLTVSEGLEAGVYHHYAVTYDGDNKTVYVDGTAALIIQAAPPVYGTDTRVFVGCDESAMPQQFDGYIDELYIYDGALGTDQIGTLAR